MKRNININDGKRKTQRADGEEGSRLNDAVALMLMLCVCVCVCVCACVRGSLQAGAQRAGAQKVPKAGEAECAFDVESCQRYCAVSQP